MKRTQVQLDEGTYEQLRRQAFERGISIAALIRETLHEQLGTRSPSRRRLDDFHFIASGCSQQSGQEPISERHDEALSEYFSR